MSSLSPPGRDINQTFLYTSPFHKDLEKMNIGITQPETTSIDSFNKIYHSSNDLFILSLNCCSLLSKLNDIQIFISSLLLKPDILCLQEIFYVPPDFDLGIPGYTFHSKQRKNSRGGGVGILVRDKFKSEEILSPFNENIFECIALKISDSESSFIIANFYRPPRGNLDEFNEVYINFLENINQINLPSFIVCDSNIDILEKTKISSGFIESSLSLGFVNFINQATRIIYPAISGIDQVFTNSPTLISNAGVLLDSPSDHFFTYIMVYKNKKVNKEHSNIMHRNFSKNKIITINIPAVFVEPGYYENEHEKNTFSRRFETIQQPSLIHWVGKKEGYIMDIDKQSIEIDGGGQRGELFNFSY